MTREEAIKQFETLLLHVDTDRVMGMKTTEAINMGIEALRQPEQRWIPVTERLPREYTRVIGYMAWHAMTAIEYQHGRWYSIDHLEPLPDEAVSHWMPLPKPPKEKKDEL